VATGECFIMNEVESNDTLWSIVSNLFEDRGINHEQFLIFRSEINENFACTIYCQYALWDEEVSTVSTKDTITPGRLLYDVSYCDFIELPLHINGPFKKVAAWRLKHNV